MISVEVVFVAPKSESLIALQLENGATVADAVAASELQAVHPAYRFAEMATGVWGQRVARDHLLKDGDRVEIYRELERDPMDARRLRALG
ncbi:MAG: RnfH family protein [Woeseiaceae bacterium]